MSLYAECGHDGRLNIRWQDMWFHINEMTVGIIILIKEKLLRM